MISPTELAAFIEATYAGDPNTANAKKTIVPKKHGLTTTAIAVAGIFTGQIAISANGDFFLTRILYRASLAGAAQTISTVPVPNVRVLFSDTGTDEQWSNQAVDLNQWGIMEGGGAELEQPYPRIISGRATVNVQITSFEAVSTPIIDLTLDGVLVKVY